MKNIKKSFSFISYIFDQMIVSYNLFFNKLVVLF